MSDLPYALFLFIIYFYYYYYFQRTRTLIQSYATTSLCLFHWGYGKPEGSASICSGSKTTWVVMAVPPFGFCSAWLWLTLSPEDWPNFQAMHIFGESIFCCSSSDSLKPKMQNLGEKQQHQRKDYKKVWCLSGWDVSLAVEMEGSKSNFFSMLQGPLSCARQQEAMLTLHKAESGTVLPVPGKEGWRMHSKRKQQSLLVRAHYAVTETIIHQPSLESDL